MNVKIEKFIKNEGFCCLWAWFEASKRVYTSVLLERLENICTQRALRYQRAAYRHGKMKCEDCSNCLKKKIRDGWITHKTETHPHKARDSDVG